MLFDIPAGFDVRRVLGKKVAGAAEAAVDRDAQGFLHLLDPVAAASNFNTLAEIGFAHSILFYFTNDTHFAQLKLHLEH